MPYRVKDWGRHFDTSETRKLKRLSWVPVPNKHDGKSFRRIMRMPNGLEIYGIWHLVLQLASKMHQRGVLEDQDGPLRFEDMADKTGAPAESFEMALKVLCSPDIGWVEDTNLLGSQGGLLGSQGDLRKEGKGREGKGSELTRRELKGSEAVRQDQSIRDRAAPGTAKATTPTDSESGPINGNGQVHGNNSKEPHHGPRIAGNRPPRIRLGIGGTTPTKSIRDHVRVYLHAYQDVDGAKCIPGARYTDAWRSSLNVLRSCKHDCLRPEDRV